MEQVPQPQEQATLRKDEDMWILRVETNGVVQEYRCATEVQARALAILLLPAGEAQPPERPPTLS